MTEKRYVVDALESQIRAEVEKTPAPGRHCARSALRHLDLAERIREVDPAMSYFRIITAEEEAASAVFHAIRRWKYTGSERLNPKNHVHKLALRPFLLAVQSFLWRLEVVARPEFHSTERGERVRIRLLGEQESLLDPPLDLNILAGTVSEDGGAPRDGELYRFEFELDVVTQHQGAETILSYVRGQIEERRQLLYGGTEGIWAMEEFDDTLFEARRRIVLGHLLLFLMIDPFPQRQLLVQQCLDTFLQEMALLPKESELAAAIDVKLREQQPAGE